MVDGSQSGESNETAEEGVAVTSPAPRRGPGHRADMRDTVAEMTERAQLISQEAGSKIAGAMRDVISAAAGLAGFAIESARDLVQYMVRRGQMTAEEADRLLREVEEAHNLRPEAERNRPTATKIAADRDAAARAAAIAAAVAAAAAPPAMSAPVAAPVRPSAPPAKVPTAKPAAKPAAKAKSDAAHKAKPAAKAPAKAAKPASKAKSATKTVSKSASRPAAKSAASKPAAKPSKTAAKKKR